MRDSAAVTPALPHRQGWPHHRGRRCALLSALRSGARDAVTGACSAAALLRCSCRPRAARHVLTRKPLARGAARLLLLGLGHSRQRAPRLPWLQRVCQGPHTSCRTPQRHSAARSASNPGTSRVVSSAPATQAMRAIARAQEELELTLESVNYQGATARCGACALLNPHTLTTLFLQALQATPCRAWRASATGQRITCTCWSLLAGPARRPRLLGPAPLSLRPRQCRLCRSRRRASACRATSRAASRRASR